MTADDTELQAAAPSIPGPRAAIPDEDPADDLLGFMEHPDEHQPVMVHRGAQLAATFCAGCVETWPCATRRHLDGVPS